VDEQGDHRLPGMMTLGYFVALAFIRAEDDIVPPSRFRMSERG
jgi:hypothetical protein